MNKKVSIKLTAFFAAFFVFLAIGITAFMFTGANYGTVSLGLSGISETDSGIYINIVKPSGWKTKEAQINIEFQNQQNRSIKAIRVKNGEKGTWTDVTQDPYIVITENSTVYVEIEDRNGNVVSKSRYIEVFDREKPTVKASITGRLLKVSAIDTISGVKAIYVNGELYDDLTNDTISVTINKNFGADITIQAEDNAGNMSQVYTTKNPLDTSNTSTTRTAADIQDSTTAQGAATIAPTTIQSTAGQASTSEVQKEGTADTKENSTATGAAYTDDKKTNGSASSNDEIIVGTFEDTNKQFMSVVTKEGQTFYLIIDHDKDSENVYFLTEITLSDLDTVAATDDATVLANNGNSTGGENGKVDAIDGGMSTDEVELILKGEDGTTDGNSGDDSSEKVDVKDSGKSELSDENSETTNDNEDIKKKNPIPGWIVIFLLIAAVGFGGYMYFVFLPKKRAKEAFVDEEDNDESYSEEYQEYEDFTDTDDLEDEAGEVTVDDIGKSNTDNEDLEEEY